MSKRAKPGWSHPRYRLVERLGRGGMGTVYLAEDLLITGRRVALKTYPTQKFPELLQAEFSNLRKLRHPGIAKAFHFGFAEPAAQPFFTMEHLRGAPLDDYLDRLGPPDRGERLRVGGELFVQIASALDYMHRQGLLHLDLKPGNILVLDPADETSPPLAVLIDLGLAQAEGETGTTRGTLPYIAPERLKGRPPDARTDLYSLGATFFRVLTGRHAFRGRSAQDYIQAHLEREPPPAPELPGPLRKILYKLLAKNPSSRFANSSALVQALLTSRDDRNAVFLPSPEGALLVGRDGELETIESWTRPDPSRSAVLAVEGGPGMGKTRMLEEAEAIISLHGDGSVFQRVEGGEGADWILELVDQVAILFPPSRREASRYGPLFDGRSRRVRRPADRPEVSSVVDRDGPRALEAQAARWLTERMRERGLYILIDDADRLGAAAGRFLQDLLRRFRGRESAVTATRGKSKRRRGGVIVSRGPGSPLIFEDETIMTLGRLRASDVRQWAECVDLDGIRSGSRRAYRDLFTLSGGVPLLVSLELSARELTGRERRSRRPLDDPLEHVRRLVDSRRGSERRVLEHVALAFMAPTLELLARVLDWSPETVSREVRLLVAAGFLRTDREAGVRFVHDSARDRVLERIPASRKRSIHSRLAREKGETTEAQLESAYHLLKAGEASQALEPARSALDIDPVSRAGRSDLVFEVVDGILRSRSLKGPTRWRFADLHAELLLSRGQLDEARSELRSLLRAKSSMTTRDRVTVRRRLARAFHLLGKPRAAQKELRHCLQQLQGESPGETHLAVLAELSILAHFMECSEESAARAREGLSIWRKLSPKARARARQQAVHLHAILGQVLIRALRFGEAIEVLEAGRKLAGESPVNACLLLNNLALAYHLGSHLTRALKTFERAGVLASDLADENMRIAIDCNVAQIRAKLGSFALARNLLEEAEGRAAVMQSKRLRFHVLYTRALVDSLEDGSDEAPWSEVQRVADELGDSFLSGFAALYSADCALTQGRYSEARARLASFLVRSPGPGSPLVDSLQRQASARLATLEAELGRSSTARAALHQDSERRELDYPEAWSRLYIAQAESVLGGFRVASEQLRECLKFFAKRSIIPGVIECRLLLADTSLRADDLSTCQRELQSVELVLKALGHTGDVRGARVRVPLLRARSDLIRGPRGDDVEALARRVRDCLAQAEGEPSLEDRPMATLEAACVRFALARISGTLAEIDRARAARDEARDAILSELSRDDARCLRTCEPMARFGLTTYSDPEALEPEGVAAFKASERQCALEDLLEFSSRGFALDAEEAAAEALRRTIRPVDGIAAAFTLAPGSDDLGAGLATWPRRIFRPSVCEQFFKRLPPVGSADSVESVEAAVRRVQTSSAAVVLTAARSWLNAPLIVGGRLRGQLVVFSTRPLAEISSKDLRYLRTAACALVPLLTHASAAGLAEKDTPSISTTARTASRFSEITHEMTRPLERGDHASAPTATVRIDARIVAASPAMRKVLEAIDDLKGSDLPVLITGEAGTGKDLVARRIHETSARRDRPFVVQNLGSVPEGLLEADLFGAKRGAFTGADRTRSGFLLQAKGGTFLLDEIAEVSTAVQGRILRVIEDQRVRPVGAQKYVTLDVRFLATSQRNLDEAVENGTFRRDLFYRLRGAHIHCQPLRERLEDVLPLLRHFFLVHGGFVPRISRAVRGRLLAHPWPGNARELEAFVRRLGLGRHPDSPALTLADIEEGLSSPSPSSSGPISSGLFHTHSYEELQRSLDLAHLRHLFEAHGGRLEEVAEVLGASTRSLYRRLEKYGLKPKDLLRELALPSSGTSRKSR